MKSRWAGMFGLLVAFGVGCQKTGGEKVMAMPHIPSFNIFDPNITTPEQLASLQSRYGVTFGAASVYCNLTDAFDIGGVRQIHSLGLMPQVVWEFGSSDQIIPHKAIIANEWDDQLREAYGQIKNLGYEIRIAIFAEANLAEQPWTAFPPKDDTSPLRTNSPDTLKQAFRHVVQLSRDEGVTNVKWVWCMNRRFTGDTGPFAQCYPGSEWVDVKAFDGYNQGHLLSDSWDSPATVYEPSLRELVAIDPDHPKPIMVFETGCVDEVPQDHATKAQWISNFVQLLPTLRAQGLEEITLFRTIKKEDGTNGRVTVDWTFDSKPQNLAAWQASIAKLSQ